MSESSQRDGLDPSHRCTNPELEGLLQEGIDAARSGHDQRARDLILQVLEQDPSSVPAWLWLSGVVDTPGEKELCLEQVISIDPDHTAARRGLVFLWEQRRAQKRYPAGSQAPMQRGVPEAESPSPAQLSSAPDPVPPLDVTPEPTTAHVPTEVPFPGNVDTMDGTPVQAETNVPAEISVPGEAEVLVLADASSRAEVLAPVKSSVDSAAAPVADIDDLMRPAIAAARSGHAQRARDLLTRVITVDEKYVSAWMWLSYVASDEDERDRCLRKVLTLAVPGMAPTLAPAGAIAGRGPVAQPVRGPVSRPGARPVAPAAPASAVTETRALAPLQAASIARLVARPTLPRPLLPDAALFDGAGLTRRLRTLYLEWATTWTFIALAYLAAIAVAEILTVFAPPRVGLVAHSAVLLVVLIHAARVDGKKEQAFLVSLAFAPLIRILSLSLPLANLPLLYWYPITSIPLFAAVLIAAPTLGYKWPDLGLNLRRWVLQLVIGLSGIAFGVFEYWILRPEPLVPAFEWTALVWPAFILLISTGLLEEMIFRGLLQRASIDVLGLWGIGYVAILFAVLHAGYQSLLDVLFVAAVGLFFGWIVYRTRSLLGVTLAHGLTNIVLFLVMPFVLG
jgi:membrane protease YdiL (CAAX protease family)